MDSERNPDGDHIWIWLLQATAPVVAGRISRDLTSHERTIPKTRRPRMEDGRG